MLRVLMIGAGRRAEGNFLPALKLLSPRFECVGIHTRTMETLAPVAERWGVPAISSLEQVDFSMVDAVAISVPTFQNAVVLKKLTQLAPQVAIVIDTPLAWTPRELADCTRQLLKFERVLITEDYMNFPSYSLMRDAASAGLIGNVKTITLTNVGYLYHGLALIRSFQGFHKASRTWSASSSGMSTVTGYRFPTGIKAFVIGPYRRLTSGGLLVEGTKGFISDHPTDGIFAKPGHPGYLLERVKEDDSTTAFSLSGTDGKFLRLTPEMKGMEGLPFKDKSDLNLQRGSGLMQVFLALVEPENQNNRYGFKNAIYDSFASRAAIRGILPIDPFTSFGSDAVNMASSVLRFAF